jgi:hypothetical protein
MGVSGDVGNKASPGVLACSRRKRIRRKSYTGSSTLEVNPGPCSKNGLGGAFCPLVVIDIKLLNTSNVAERTTLILMNPFLEGVVNSG